MNVEIQNDGYIDILNTRNTEGENIYKIYEYLDHTYVYL